MDLLKIVALAIVFNGFFAFKALAVKSYQEAMVQLKHQPLEQSKQSLSILLNSGQFTVPQEIALQLEISKRLFTASQFNLVIEQLTALIIKAHEHQLKDQVADLNKYLGIVLFHTQDYHKAIAAYHNALNYYLETDHNIELAHIHNNIALSYIEIGDFELALTQLEHAKPLYLAHGTKQDQLDLELNFAVLFSHLSKHGAAITIYEALINYYTQHNDHHHLALLQGNIGVSFRLIEQYDKAINAHHHALAFYQRTKQPQKASEQALNIAEVYLQTKALSKAQSYLSQSREMVNNTPNQLLEFNQLYLGAKMHLATGEIDHALKQGVNALAIAKKLNTLSHQIKAHEQLIYAYAASGNIDKAYAHDKMRKQLSTQAGSQKAALEIDMKSLDQQTQALKAQVRAFEQNKQIHSLELASSQQKQNFMMLVVVLIIVLFISIYKRTTERHNRHQLESLVRARTKELEKLTEKLHQANQVKSQFLANMSHEIRTPLTAVIGHSESIMQDDLSQNKVSEYVTIINRNSRHLLDLINDILDISRIEANKLTLELDFILLSDLLDYLDAMYQEMAHKKGIKFTLDNQTQDGLNINVDEFRLKQILLNLCSNAIKFTQHGEVNVTITETCHGIKFIVKDTGIGMDETQLDEIFDCFTQGDNSISRRFGGSGLGLSLSEQLANLMGGSISVDSEQGKGSEFTLHLKVTKKLLPIDKPKPSKTIDNTRYQGDILLAEDHPDNRELIKRILEQLGFNVQTAENGEQAITLCLKNHFDVILMDIQMPVKDGIDALKELKVLNYPAPIIAVTANAMSHEIAEYMALGFAAHIKKPLEQQQFLQTLDQFFKVKSASQKVTEVKSDDLKSKFITSFLSEISSLEKHQQAKNWQAMSQQAHKIRGAASMFKMHSLEEAAHYLEQATKFNDFDAIPEAIEGVIFSMQNQLNV